MTNTIQHDGFFIPSSLDGSEIYVYRWLPSNKEIKGSVLIAHGMAEHAARYNEFAGYLANLGFAVYAQDHLGHGKTAEKNGIKGYFAESSGWEHVVRDIESVRKLAQKTHPGLPIALFGHSMGSLLARTHMMMFPNSFCMYILSGPAHNSPAVTKAGKILAQIGILFKGDKHRSKIMDSLSFGRFNKKFAKEGKGAFAWLCKDEERLKLYENDELCGFIFTLKGFKDLLGGMEICTKKKNLSKIKGEKVLLVAGADDPVGGFGKGVAKIEQILQKAGAIVKKEIFPDLRHELINEPEKHDVFELIYANLNEKCV